MYHWKHRVFDFVRHFAQTQQRWRRIQARLVAASQWGSCAIESAIDPSVICNNGRAVRLGRRCRLGAGVELLTDTGRYGINKPSSITIGSMSGISSYTTLGAYGSTIEIGERTYIGTHCHFGAYDKGIKIGSNVLIASHCSMVDTQHLFDSTQIPIVDQGISSKGILIENDVWLGSGVVIMDGVLIGEGSIVGAGSVVTKDIPPFQVWAGVPARFFRTRVQVDLADSDEARVRYDAMNVKDRN